MWGLFVQLSYSEAEGTATLLTDVSNQKQGPDALTGRILLNYLFCVVCCLLTCGDLVSGRELRHKLPDGFVERAVSVIVRDQTATIKYYFGVNDETMASLLEKCQPDQMSDGSETASETKQSDRTEQEKVLLKKLCEGLTVHNGDKSLELLPLKIVISPKHHFSYLAEFEFKITSNGQHDIVIEDTNFQEMESAVRYSLKAAGSTMLLQSNVAPIIIRANRHELHKLKPEKRTEACKIRATLAIQIDDSTQG